MQLKHITIFCDGGSRGNPGPAAAGVVIVNEVGETLTRFGTNLGIATNNSAEYQAVISAFGWLQKNMPHVKTITFKLDSLLVVKQLMGEYRVKDSALKLLYTQVKDLEKKLSANFHYVHISRADNRQADRMVNQTLDTRLAGVGTLPSE